MFTNERPKIACVIPARFQSVRFPGKLLKLAQGKTVLQRTFESAQKAKTLDCVYVATDDIRIVDHIKSLKGNVLLTSANCFNGTERIREAFQNSPELQKASIIVNVQGDHPLIESKTIDAVVGALKNHPEAHMATAVTRLNSWESFLSPHTVKCVFDSNGKALYFSRSPIPHHRPGSPLNSWGHIGLYAYRASFFSAPPLSKTPLQIEEDLEQLAVLESGRQIQVACVEEHILGVDVPEDLVQLEKILCLQNISS